MQLVASANDATSHIEASMGRRDPGAPPHRGRLPDDPHSCIAPAMHAAKAPPAAQRRAPSRPASGGGGGAGPAAWEVDMRSASP